ncbi:MAG: NB-ARC domain-containing protein [Cyanobacteria bacterium J06621_15]
MSDSRNPEQPSQNIFSNVSAENITTGDITQIYKIVVNLDQIPKPQGIPQNIISSSTDKFVGRERDLENLNQQLQRHNQVVIAAVEGMGGVGKTELAIQYSLLNLQLETYPGGICWIRAREQDIGLQIVNFARTDLDLNPPDDLELPDKVRWCWKRWREGNTLIVLDDVKDYSDIKPYLPPQQFQFKVLITTRLKLDLPSSLYLAVLSEADSLQLLSQLVGEEKVEQELETAQELCQRLGYLPLALQSVGRYVKENDISLKEELELLETKGLSHPSMEVPENDPTWTSYIQRGVEAAFELSWEQLKKFKLTQELGCLLSLFALAPIPWEIVVNASSDKDVDELRAARVKLEKFHLVQKLEQKKYQLHQLIQEFFEVKFKLQENKHKYQLKKLFCHALVEQSKLFYAKNISNFSSYIPHTIKAEEKFKDIWLENKNIELAYLGLAKYYDSKGDYSQVEIWSDKGLLVAQRTDRMYNLALCYEKKAIAQRWLSKFEEAKSNLHNSLNNLPLHEIPKRIDIVNELILISIDVGENDKTYEYYELVLDLLKQYPYPKGELKALYGMTRRFIQINDYKKSNQTLERIIEIYNNHLVEEKYKVDYAFALKMQGQNLADQSRNEEALELISKAHEIFKNSKHEMGLAWSYYNLSIVKLNLNEIEDAQNYIDEALKFFKKLSSQTGLAWSKYIEGRIKFRQQKWELVRECYKAALNEWNSFKYSGLAFTFEGFAHLAIVVKKYEIAAHMVGIADSVRGQTGSNLPPVDQMEYNQSLNKAIKAIGRERFEVARNFGYKMSLESAKLEALQI